MAYRDRLQVDGKIDWTERWAHMTRLERVLMVFAFANFFAALALGMWLGGDGLQGKIEDGRYLLGNKGNYREVGAGTYWFSRYQLLSALAALPLGALAQWRGHLRARAARKKGD